MNFDPAFFDQGFEAVVQTAHAHPKFFSQLTLSDLGSDVQDAHDPEVSVLLLVGLAASHEEINAVGRLPQCLTVSAAFENLGLELGRL